MRLITLEEAVNLTTEMFDDYVEHVGMSFMCGEVPSIMFTVHKRGTREKDWLARVRFKNTLAISVFKCEVWLDDIFRLCRLSKLYLITEEVFRVSALYAMLHPLYQSQFIDFKVDVEADYDSMMMSAGKAAYRFMANHFRFGSRLERVVLNILDGFNTEFTNRHSKESARAYQEAQQAYEMIMLTEYQEAYRVARFRKAQTMLIDLNGFVRMEQRTKGGTTYYHEQEGEGSPESSESVRLSDGSSRPREFDDSGIPHQQFT